MYKLNAISVDIPTDFPLFRNTQNLWGVFTWKYRETGIVENL